MHTVRAAAGLTHRLARRKPTLSTNRLRHYFVTTAIWSGIDFKTIAGVVGHKDGGVLVAKTHGHLRDSRSTVMVKRMTFRA